MQRNFSKSVMLIIVVALLTWSGIVLASPPIMAAHRYNMSTVSPSPTSTLTSPTHSSSGNSTGNADSTSIIVALIGAIATLLAALITIVLPEILKRRKQAGGKQDTGAAETGPSPTTASRPRNHIPHTRKPFFQPRPGEFEQLENLFFVKSPKMQSSQMISLPRFKRNKSQPAIKVLKEPPPRVGLVGLAGVGKTTLAVEFVYYYQQYFSDGIFWMTATGDQENWKHQLAVLASETGYLPKNDNPSSSENESQRAKHFLQYLADHSNALLVLDNVDIPDLVVSALPSLAGQALKCSILYTSRITQAPDDIKTHPTRQLREREALHLLLEKLRPELLHKALEGHQDPGVDTAKRLCEAVGYLPLGLIHLRALLEKNPFSLVRLARAVHERGALEIANYPSYGAAPLFATFSLSWEQVKDEDARQLFMLAGFFPKAAPIPLWLLGLAGGMGENADIWEPLGRARIELQERSLIDEPFEGTIQLHPLVWEFARRIVSEEQDQGKNLIREASERLSTEFKDLGKLEHRARKEGYWQSLDQLRAAHSLAVWLGADAAGQLAQVERWLSLESDLLEVRKFWPGKLPGLFYQQFYNRGVKEGHLLAGGNIPLQWMRLLEPVYVEDKALLRVFNGHQNSVTSVAFSPDGSKILTGSWDNTARLWNIVTGQQILTFTGHQEPVQSVAFSPDGSKILTGSRDHTARLWDATDGKLLMTFIGHQDRVWSATFSPDGTKVLTGSWDNTARLWNVANGKALATFAGHQEPILSVAFSPDGTKILTGSRDHTARLWDAASGQLLLTLTDHEDDVNSVAFSPDGSKILTGSDDLKARLWDITGGQPLLVLTDHENSITGVAFSPDGARILTGSWSAMLWDTASGQPLLKFAHHQNAVWSIAFSPDGTKILTCFGDQRAYLWDATLNESEENFKGHESHIQALVFSPDGTRFLTGSGDQTARLWDVVKREPTEIFSGHQGAVWGVAFSPDGTKILTGSQDNTAQVWDVANGQSLLTLSGHTGVVECVAFSPDGSKILTGSWDNTARLWDATSGQLLLTLADHNRGIQAVAFSLDGSKILTGSWDNTARLWDATSGQLLLTLAGHKHIVTSVAFSPDGGKILTGSYDQTARIWDIDGKLLVTLSGHRDSVMSVMFSPDSRFALTCDGVNQVYLWDQRSARLGQLLGIYTATHRIWAVHWLIGKNQLLLADRGGALFRPNLHYLQMEGM
jgi:WD40 repeat protein